MYCANSDLLDYDLLGLFLVIVIYDDFDLLDLLDHFFII